VKGIADTGFLVAFANRNDNHHAWSVSVAAELTEPLLTCEAVLAETAFHLRDANLAIQMVEEKLVEIAFALPEHLAQVAALARRYADRSPDLADLCLIRMSELFPRHALITIDRADFRVFRRNKREAIPLLCPPD
jgi:predicted nucleic acid-binding protein